MLCKNCGAQIEETEIKCNVCGTTNESLCAESGSTDQNSMHTLSIWSLIGLIVGIIFIIVGFKISGSAETSLAYATFGADFYTYTYRGLRAVESALVDATKAISNLIIVVGAFMSCYFGKNLKK